jgi:hypothetical protein
MELISYGGWDNCVRLENSDMELVVTTDVGPRVIRCGFKKKHNLLKEYTEQLGRTGDREWNIYGGHRLWHAPEVAPRTYWPDNETVPYTWDGKTLRLAAPVEASNGVRKVIEITLDPRKNYARLVHRIINDNPWDIELAPWCLTVMAPGGRAVFPQEDFRPHPEYFLPARPLVLWHYTDMNDPRWTWGEKYIQLKQDSNAKSKQKLGMLNKQGWAAYYLRGTLFMKCIAAQPDATYPDYGCNMETFTDPDMLEVETLGPTQRLAANGGSVEHTEHWFLFDTRLGTTESTLDKTLLPLVEKAKRAMK